MDHRTEGRAQTSEALTLASLGGPRNWFLSPSDFAFLWDECRRCFYRKAKLRQRRPRAPFPKVFTIIDRQMKRSLLGERLEDLAVGARPGSIGSPDRWVKSAHLTIPGTPSTVVIQGRVDALVDHDDDSVGVVDLKTADPKVDHLAKYSRQLHAYAMALEQPSSGPSVRVSSLGLLCFSPSRFEVGEAEAALLGSVGWISVERDDAAFSDFLGEVVSILDREALPPASPGCSFCAAEARVTARAA